MKPFLSARKRNALRAIAATWGGLRITAHPATMPGLEALGLIKQRDRYRGRPGERVWMLTAAGRRVLAEIGRDEA